MTYLYVWPILVLLMGWGTMCAPLLAFFHADHHFRVLDALRRGETPPEEPNWTGIVAFMIFGYPAIGLAGWTVWWVWAHGFVWSVPK